MLKHLGTRDVLPTIHVDVFFNVSLPASLTHGSLHPLIWCCVRSLSNTGGGGRGGNQGNIVGDVILKGKKQYWERGADYFYHRGLPAGENTVEGPITRYQPQFSSKHRSGAAFVAS